MSTTEQPLSVRQELTKFVKAEFEADDNVAIGEVISRILDQTDGDEVFREALALQALRLLVPEIANSVRHQLRVDARNGKNGEDGRQRLAKVFAFTGTPGESKSFLVMRRPDHIFAAEDSEGQAKGHLRRAALHRAAAELLEDDEQITGEALTDYQLETLAAHWLQNESPPVPWLTR